jgi:hypothetical protein
VLLPVPVGPVINTAWPRAGANVIWREPEVALTFKQVKEILAKNAKTIWKKDAELSDDEADTLTTKSKHELHANLYFDFVFTISPPKADHNSIRYIVVVDDTVHTQIQKESNAADKENKAKEDQKTQSDVNGL